VNRANLIAQIEPLILLGSWTYLINLVLMLFQKQIRLSVEAVAI